MTSRKKITLYPRAESKMDLISTFKVLCYNLKLTELCMLSASPPNLFQINFYSRDLMSIYNHDMLNQRLRRENTPVMFVGRSSALSSRTVSSKNVVFAIDIESSKPEEEVIVGIRVELTDSYRPQFLSVSDFNDWSISCLF